MNFKEELDIEKAIDEVEKIVLLGSALKAGLFLALTEEKDIPKLSREIGGFLNKMKAWPELPLIIKGEKPGREKPHDISEFMNVMASKPDTFVEQVIGHCIITAFLELE